MTASRTDQRIILSIETTLSGGSLAILCGGNVFADAGSVSRSESLLPAIENLLRKSSLEIGDITLITVSVGPGSFTGIRIGISTALGLKASLGIPCLGITTSEAVASTIPDVDRYAVVPVGREQYVIQYFQAGKTGAADDAKFEVVTQDEIWERMIKQLQGTFVIAKEADDFDLELTRQLHNVVMAEESIAALMCSLVSNGYGRPDLTPIYARREINSAQ